MSGIHTQQSGAERSAQQARPAAQSPANAEETGLFLAAPALQLKASGLPVQRAMGDGHDLQSPRFAGDATLEAVFDNEQTMRNGATGPAVVKIQEALIAAGFPLAQHGADGDFGDETQTALQSYQRTSGFTGNEVDGILGPQTMQALDNRFGAGANQTQPPDAYQDLMTPPEFDLSPEGIGDMVSYLGKARLAQSAGFQALPPEKQVKLMVYVTGQNVYICQPASNDFWSKVQAGTLDLNDSAALDNYLTTQPAVPGLVASNVPNGHFDSRRASYTVSSPTVVTGHNFRAGVADAERYEVEIDGQTIPVMRPLNPDPTNGSFHTAEQAARSLAALPEANRQAVVRIEIEPARNPDDAYWATQYNQPGFRSYMTAGASGVINIYPSSGTPTQDQMDTSLIHETGHTVSDQRWTGNHNSPDWNNWQRAGREDIIVPSTYARSSPGEDFAESMALLQTVRSSSDETEVRMLMPNRMAILDTVLAGRGD